MPVVKSFNSHKIDYIIWELTETVDELEKLLSCSTLISQGQSLKTDKRKKEFLSSRILLKLLIKDCPKVEYDNFGAPFILNSDEKISISHSGIYVVVAKSESRVGIDIEQISEKLARTKHKYSSEKELSFIDKNQELFHLALYWSAKESVYKLVGNEALIFDTDMQIGAFIPKKESHFSLKLESKMMHKSLLINYQKILNYVFTYCVLDS